jgi:hypothetical protein
MATTAADPVFVATNILVYANTATAPWHARAQAALRSLDASGAELFLDPPARLVPPARFDYLPGRVRLR